LTVAAAGAATGGLIGGLTSAGVSDSDARMYERRPREGGVLLTVHTTDDMSDEVADVLDNNGARNVDEESDITAGRDYTHSGGSMSDKAIPVVEEHVEIGKREVGQRAVRVYSNVTETPVQKDVELREETIRVERRPVNRAGHRSRLQPLP